MAKPLTCTYVEQTIRVCEGGSAAKPGWSSCAADRTWRDQDISGREAIPTCRWPAPGRPRGRQGRGPSCGQPGATEHLSAGGWRRASEARDETHRRFVRDAHADQDGNRLGHQLVHKNLKNKKVTSATDPETGPSAGGVNGSARGGWGCAEKNALDNLDALRAERGLDPLEPYQVDFTRAHQISIKGRQTTRCRSAVRGVDG